MLLHWCLCAAAAGPPTFLLLAQQSQLDAACCSVLPTHKKTTKTTKHDQIEPNQTKPILVYVWCAASGTWFYIATSWLATFFVRLGTPERITLWMNISGLTIMTVIAPVSWLSRV